MAASIPDTDKDRAAWAGKPSREWVTASWHPPVAPQLSLLGAA